MTFRDPYTGQRRLDQLRRRVPAVFVSHHDGFGLAFLEAIAAPASEGGLGP